VARPCPALLRLTGLRDRAANLRSTAQRVSAPLDRLFIRAVASAMLLTGQAPEGGSGRPLEAHRALAAPSCEAVS